MRIAVHCGITLAILACLAGFAVADPPESNDGEEVPYHAQGEKAGDPKADSIILLTRLTAVEKGEIEQDVPGMDGLARFEISETPDFKASRMTSWAEANASNDHTIKQTVSALKPGRDYWYRVHITDPAGKGKRVGPPRSFETAPSAEQRRNVRFAVITGQGYATRDNDRGH